jgi:hypothetical protein
MLDIETGFEFYSAGKAFGAQAFSLVIMVAVRVLPDTAGQTSVAMKAWRGF